ncbi:MAG: hypothetical protein IPN90_12700 [Elusimicrobia bacterium]|nr:hypothetical protein [Elusimicrobiota bacterium]
MGYAKNLKMEFPFIKGSETTLGATLKYLRTRFTLDESTSNDPVFSGGQKTDAVTGDVGALVRKGSISTGLSFKNVTEPDFGLKESDRVPLETRFSGAYAGHFWFLENTTVAIDLVLVRNETNLCAGWENIFFNDQAAFRLGVNRDEFTAGLGWRYVAARPSLDLGFDYVYVLPLDMVDNQAATQRLTFNVRFGR